MKIDYFLIKKYRKIFYVGFSILLLFGSILFYVSVRNRGVLTVSFLDVGQGDAILIQTPSNKTMLIDGGPGNAVERGLGKALPLLNPHVDVVLATHPDADHITGLIPVLKRYNAKITVVSPAKGDSAVYKEVTSAFLEENKEGAEAYIGNVGDSVDFGDGVVFTLVYPKTENWHGEDTNDMSVVGLLTYGMYSFLLTGDLPSTYEDDVIKSGLVPQNITVLKAGHHGSKYSSSAMFLNYLKPTYTVISAGKDNRYGHPNPETIGRLETVSKSILSTIDHGTVSFTVDGKDMSIALEK